MVLKYWRYSVLTNLSANIHKVNLMVVIVYGTLCDISTALTHSAPWMTYLISSIVHSSAMFCYMCRCCDLPVLNVLNALLRVSLPLRNNSLVSCGILNICWLLTWSGKQIGICMCLFVHFHKVYQLILNFSCLMHVHSFALLYTVSGKKESTVLYV